MLAATLAGGLMALGVCSPALAGFTARADSAPSGFSAHVDNPWFPLEPGTTYVYRGVKDGKAARDVLTVTDRTTTIDGAACVVVHDRLYLRGKLAERTTDWYTQDAQGNVWYFGEATAELSPSGRVTSTEGSAAGVWGATRHLHACTPCPARPGGRNSSRGTPRCISRCSA
jgi:hypothetical protein